MIVPTGGLLTLLAVVGTASTLKMDQPSIDILEEIWDESIKTTTIAELVNVRQDLFRKGTSVYCPPAHDLAACLRDAKNSPFSYTLSVGLDWVTDALLRQHVELDLDIDEQLLAAAALQCRWDVVKAAYQSLYGRIAWEAKYLDAYGEYQNLTILELQSMGDPHLEAHREVCLRFYPPPEFSYCAEWPLCYYEPTLLGDARFAQFASVDVQAHRLEFERKKREMPYIAEGGMDQIQGECMVTCGAPGAVLADGYGPVWKIFSRIHQHNPTFYDGWLAPCTTMCNSAVMGRFVELGVDLDAFGRGELQEAIAFFEAVRSGNDHVAKKELYRAYKSMLVAMGEKRTTTAARVAKLVLGMKRPKRTHRSGNKTSEQRVEL